MCVCVCVCVCSVVLLLQVHDDLWQQGEFLQRWFLLTVQSSILLLDKTHSRYHRTQNRITQTGFYSVRRTSAASVILEIMALTTSSASLMNVPPSR